MPLHPQVKTLLDGLAAAGGVARSRHLVTEVLIRIFTQRTAGEPLLVAKLDPAQIEHRLLHRHLDPLPTAGVRTLVERSQNA